MPVLALELGTLFVGFGLGRLISQSFLGAKAEFVGFGSRLLVSNGFLCAKAERFGRLCNQVLPKKQLSSLQRLKTPEFGFRRILELFAGFFMEESCRVL